MQIGLQPLTDENGACIGFELPCPLFAGDGCPIYSVRPTICRNYRCVLLKETERGGIAIPEARGIIKRALALRELVVPQLGRMMLDSGVPCERRGTMFRLSALVAAMMKPDGESFRRQHAAALSAGVSLLILLRRYFAPVRKSNME